MAYQRVWAFGCDNRVPDQAAFAPDVQRRAKKEYRASDGHRAHIGCEADQTQHEGGIPEEPTGLAGQAPEYHRIASLEPLRLPGLLP